MSAKPLLTMNQDQKNKTLSSKFFSSKSSDLNGEITIPGDKSISHRCVILSSLAIGESKINGLLNSSDVNCTINAMKSFGASIYMSSNDECTVNGIGIGSLRQPDNPLDFGNSGTAVRLILGLVSTYPIETHFTGDDSLTQRPMRRVTDPLTDFGANFHLRNKEFLPIVVKGANLAIPITYEMEVASAQVKSAILLAGLNTPGITTVIEKEKTRDHTETLLKYYGYEISQEERNNKNFISLEGQKFLSPVNIKVPGDPSSAAYPVIAGLICKNSNIKIQKHRYKKFIKDVVNGTLERNEVIDNEIKLHLKDDIDVRRIDKVFEVILKSAIFELLYKPTTSSNIIIKEYLNNKISLLAPSLQALSYASALVILCPCADIRDLISLTINPTSVGPDSFWPSASHNTLSSISGLLSILL